MPSVLKMPLPGAETLATVQTAYQKLKEGHLGSSGPSAEEREDRLDRLERLVITHREAFVEAANRDFGGRGRHETLLVDVALTLESARDARRHVREWMKPTRVRPHLLFLGAKAWVEPCPKGVVGILAPWNYPVNLALGPLAAALAAGNRALIKPSELTPSVSKAIAAAVSEHFAADEVAVLEGDATVAQAICRLPLDHLFFTGSTAVGIKVMKAAAEHLVPVTLELGGKSPAYVQAHFPMAVAAERIALGKLFNGGQTCVAPDYALVPQGKEVVFGDAFAEAVHRHFGGGGLTAMATERGLHRMGELLADAKAKGARVRELKVGQSGARALTPALVFEVKPQMRLMQEEIFGPVLPVLTYRDEAEALSHIAAHPTPLAAYVFDLDLARASRFLRQVPSGGACINDTLAHFAQESLPFGGVGQSGMGQYHGRYGFDAFSHPRGVLVSGPGGLGRKLYSPTAASLVDSAMGLVTSTLGRWVR